MRKSNQRLSKAAYPALLIFCLLTLFTAQTVKAQPIIDYKVAVDADGSAFWRIIQPATGNASVDTWLVFQQRIVTLIADASNASGRSMAADPESFQLLIQEAGVEYQFRWLNFSNSSGPAITFGDVFRVNNFFGRLYGDGIIETTYPEGARLVSVLPAPNQRDDSQRWLQWLSTEAFAGSNPNIRLQFLAPSTSIPAGQDSPTELPFLAIAGIVSATIFVAVFLLLRRNRRVAVKPEPKPTYVTPMIESEEEKVLQFIRSCNGNVYQSVIVEQLKFSKAKTSLLLKALEANGSVTRYKKGRDKVVKLAENLKEDSK
jgi:uncharacterized membrane protein